MSRCGGGSARGVSLPPASRWVRGAAPPGPEPGCSAGTGARCACCRGWCSPRAFVPSWPPCWLSSTWVPGRRGRRLLRGAAGAEGLRARRAFLGRQPGRQRQTRARTSPSRAAAGCGATPSGRPAHLRHAIAAIEQNEERLQPLLARCPGAGRGRGPAQGARFSALAWT